MQSKQKKVLKWLNWWTCDKFGLRFAEFYIAYLLRRLSYVGIFDTDA